ncbi:SAVMC3_10250 family protein [Saccharopolyspora oryzae]|uniref:SAVMC3_10250 family protein n=1 Tax=Saccharopolyspora oryzae TaxID=2997343 RepID=A0ABT4V375_9PSEU|nr:SAVMC3_10250 family protein [Saccharopolyspora oryzae]MDA3627737.1 SAVMC3_10250 family protein [Saccharopolyspora oryzae]
MTFRYYLYVSDSKVDMLLSQIDPRFAAKRSTEVGVNLQMVSAKRSTAPTDDRFLRLERVVRYLQDHGDVGTVDEPGQFFGGLLPMRWTSMPGAADPSLVFLGGCDGRNVVGLGGSARHLLGSVPGVDDARPSSSLLPAILDQLGTASELEDELVLDSVGDDLDRTDHSALAAVHRAVRELRTPAQNVEFIAKRLLHGTGPGGDESVVLGSPIYVAQVD